MLKEFKIIDLNLIDYNEAFLYQEDLLKKRQNSLIKDTIIFCRHPSIVTLGRASRKEDVQGWSGAMTLVNRGGRATYHGPEQIVVYPIVSLKKNPNIRVRSEDIRQYLRSLEDVIVQTLLSFDLEARVKSDKPLKLGQLNRGIWIKGKKIASLGIAVKKWVTMHGVALNLKKDIDAFKGILACGFDSQTYTSLEEVGLRVSYDECRDRIIEKLRGDFS